MSLLPLSEILLKYHKKSHMLRARLENMMRRYRHIRVSSTRGDCSSPSGSRCATKGYLNTRRSKNSASRFWISDGYKSGASYGSSRHIETTKSARGYPVFCIGQAFKCCCLGCVPFESNLHAVGDLAVSVFAFLNRSHDALLNGIESTLQQKAANNNNGYINRYIDIITICLI